MRVSLVSNKSSFFLIPSQFTMAKFSSISCLVLLISVFFLFNDFCQATDIGIYELKRGSLSVKITNYGATVISVLVPDRNGKLDDVVLGFDSVDEYKNDTAYFGTLVGRVANRIGGAKFSLNGFTYHLPANDHGNTLHGGFRGFSDVVWDVSKYKEDSHLTLTYNSYDGEQGFPGKVSVMVTYFLIGDNVLALKMEAKPLNKATPINLASHSYWNLGGHNSGSIFSHTIQILGSKITPVNDKLIPTGTITPINGTAYDFLKPRTIGSKFSDLPNGYDINYVLDGNNGRHFTKAAVVQDDKSGRKMELWTDKPGVQFYTSNMLTDTKGKGGYIYKKYAGLCLETQGFPDSVNHRNFPSQIVNPGDNYKHVMVYRFTAY